MDARTITELLGGTWKEHDGVLPCSVLHPGPDPDPLSLSISDFEPGIWFNIVREGSGPGPRVYSGPWYDMPEIPGSSDAPELPSIEELKTTLRDWITRVRDAEQYYESKRRRSEQALAIRNEAQPIQGTPAEAYLRETGIPTSLALPDSLRFHANCWHPSGSHRPAMVALLTDDLHRVYPEHDLDAEEVPPFPMVHMTYLPQEDLTGDVTGPAEEVLLGEPGSAVEIVNQPLEAEAPILVAESIPSALALAAGIGRLLPRPIRIWAALSPEGTEKLRLPVQTDPPLPGCGTVWRVQDPRWIIFAPDRGAESRQAAEMRAEGARLFFHVNMVSAPEGQTWTDVRADMDRKWGWGDWGCVRWTLEIKDNPLLGPALNIEPRSAEHPALAGGDDIPF